MDPLSVSSGVVGLLAFALQMAKVASQVKRAVEQFKSAPKEMNELLERLTFLETMCNLVEMKAASKPELPGTSSSVSLGAISTALLQCQQRMESLSRTLSVTGLDSSYIKTPLSKSEALSRLRFVLRREKVRSMLQDVDHVISHLQFAINVDMWLNRMPILQKPIISCLDNTQSEVPRFPEQTGSMAMSAIPPCPAIALSKRRVAKAIPETCRTTQYLGLITWTTIETRAEDQSDDARLGSGKKGHMKLRLPFSSAQVNLLYTRFMGAPSYALRISHVIDPNSDIGKQFRNLMYGTWDLTELKRLLSERRISIYSEFEDSSLFYVSVGTGWAEGCRYLLDHDFRHSFSEEKPPETRFARDAEISSDMTCEVTEIILSMNPGQTRFENLVSLLEINTDLVYSEVYLQRFLNESGSNRQDLISYAWANAVRNTLWISREEPEKVVRWSAILGYIIKVGADIHQPVWLDHSAYFRRLVLQEDRNMADEYTQTWLLMLKLCGVAIESYIERETEAIHRHWRGECHHTWYPDYIHRAIESKKLVIIDFEGIPALSSDYDYEPGTAAYELLVEFQDLLPARDMHGALFTSEPSGPKEIRGWLESGVGDWRRSLSFPYRPTPLDYSTGKLETFVRDIPYYHDTYKLAWAIRKKRFIRREAKKWRRAHPGERLPTQRVPGAWVD